MVVEWHYASNDDRPHVNYKHDSHVEILGTQRSCENCHTLNREVDFMASYKEYDPANWVSNFESIRKKTCMQCHSESQINMDCQNCHLYHFKPSFRKDMLTARVGPVSTTH